ncbi:MAG TPA: hypothetical protein VGK48_03050 [Terriglobia bacterium]|jgi:hypothetical protein
MRNDRWPARIAVLTILSIYAASLVVRRDIMPDGLFSDTAQEALRGIYLVQGRHFEVITSSIGNSAETLYLYLVGGMVSAFGPTTIAIQLTSWLFALAIIYLICRLTTCISETIPLWVPALTAVSSLWLFHYARSGLRAIAAPFFLALFAMLLDGAERRAETWRSILCGAVLGLSVYSYTACRVLPIAFVVYAMVRCLSEPEKRESFRRKYLVIAAAAFATSIPNLLFLAMRPQDFLARGDYVLVGSAWDKLVNVASTALLPFYYPDRYRDIAGPGFFFDSISAALTAQGHSPLRIVLIAPLILGLIQTKRWIVKPAFVFLLVSWISAILILGVAGPSLTRLFIVLPVYLVLASLGFWTLVTRVPAARTGLIVLLIWIWFAGDYDYFFGSVDSQVASIYFNSAATRVGEGAERLARQGRRVLCVVSRDKDVVVFLTHDESRRVGIVEFYERPLDPSQIPLSTFQADDLLIEKNESFNWFAGRFPKEWRAGYEDGFYDIRFPTRGN